MRVDELPHDLNRQSSSACAKNALASFKLSLALRTSRTFLKSWSLLKNRGGSVHGAQWHLDAIFQQKNYLMVYHILHAYFTQPAPAYTSSAGH